MKLTFKHVQALVDERYIERGKSYLAQGMVELLTVRDDMVTARCAGTRLYRVSLTFNGNRLSGECTCPAFDDFGPCKHMAATALAVIANRKAPYTPGAVYLTRRQEADDLQRRLKRKTKAALIDMITTLIEDNPDLEWIVGDEDRDDED